MTLILLKIHENLTEDRRPKPSFEPIHLPKWVRFVEKDTVMSDGTYGSYDNESP